MNTRPELTASDTDLADAGSLLAEERFRSDELDYDNVWRFERE